jgi:antibiotic biosynthesis monooxygenase (ABM) superfamily enzyme
MLNTTTSTSPNTPRLIGPYDTQQLQAITKDPVTVTVAWVPFLGTEDAFLIVLDELSHAVRRATGSLGVALLEPGEGGGEYHLIARFASAQALRVWELSATRLEILGRLQPLAQEHMVATNHSPEAFFAALVGTSAKPVHHRWMMDIAWFLPASLLFSWFLSPYTHALPLLVRVVIGSVTVSLLYALTLGPLRRKITKRRNRLAPLR